MVGLTRDDMLSYFTYVVTEGDIPPVFTCFHNGDPSPFVNWTTMDGGSLPDGVNENSTEAGMLKLEFILPLVYGDKKTFLCTLNDTVETDYAILELIVRGNRSHCINEILYMF